MKKPLIHPQPSCKNQLPSAPEIIIIVIQITTIKMSSAQGVAAYEAQRVM
jgi:hypothetical protein